jgi:hypothetical protein
VDAPSTTASLGTIPKQPTATFPFDVHRREEDSFSGRGCLSRCVSLHDEQRSGPGQTPIKEGTGLQPSVDLLWRRAQRSLTGIICAIGVRLSQAGCSRGTATRRDVNAGRVRCRWPLLNDVAELDGGTEAIGSLACIVRALWWVRLHCMARHGGKPHELSTALSHAVRLQLGVVLLRPCQW